MMTNEEMLVLAKKCGATDLEPFSSTFEDGKKAYLFTETELLAYTSAIEEKHQAQIAMLVDKGKQLLDNSEEFEFDDGMGRGADNTFWNEFEEAIPATQSTAAAFIAEVKAGERRSLADWMDAHSISHVSANWLRSPSAELRNQAQAEGEVK